MAKLNQEILPLLIGLKDKGITKIEIAFSGSGDSGDVDDLQFYAGAEYISHYQHEDKPQVKDYISVEQYNKLRDASYELIDECIEGADWYNNDGGYGRIDINLESMTADVEYSQRTTHDYSWEDVSIFDI